MGGRGGGIRSGNVMEQEEEEEEEKGDEWVVNRIRMKEQQEIDISFHDALQRQAVVT